LDFLHIVPFLKEQLMTIFSYKITYDTGAAPCIQNNLFSLAICKPRIRKCAKIGDYIIGFYASSVSQNNSISYIAKITDKKTFKEYYKTHSERTDCIYDDQLNLLKNPFHKSCHIECDLKGEYICIFLSSFCFSRFTTLR